MREALLDASAKAANRVVSFRDLHGGPGTLAEAAELIRNEGGRLDVANGRLFVVIPPTAPGGGFRVDNGRVRGAAQLLYMGEELVVAALKAKRPLLEEELTPAGALVPAKYQNHRRAEP
jgi:hypothetical protein